MAVGNFFVSADKAVSRKSAGHDFLAFYTAGHFVREGRTDLIYDLDSVRAFQGQIAQRYGLELRSDVLGPFWNPPFFALVFAPLAALEYPTAWNVWFAINVAALLGAISLLVFVARKNDDWRTWGLVPLLILTCPPLIQALGHGQNTCISLLLLAITVTLWQSDRAMLAGAAAGLLFYKPQLGAIVALALVLSLGWRPLAGLAMTGTALLLTTLIALPSTLSTFLQRLPGNIAYMQVEHRYYWDRHVTLKAFWRLLLQGYDAGDLTPLTRVLYFASIAVVASLLLVTIWKLRGDRASRDRLIAMTIVAMPLLMPFYFDYDLLLLAAAGVLTAREVMDSQQPLSKWLLTTWIALFFWTMFNPAIAGRFHVNGSVILLTTLTGLLIARARKLVANTKVETNQAPRTIGKLRPYDAAA